MGAVRIPQLVTLDAAALFRAHAAFVARILARSGVAQRDLEDLVQEVFLVAHRRGGFVVETAKPTTWLARIALGLAANHRRKNRPVPTDPRRADDLRGSESADAGEVRRRVQFALGSMSEGKRLVFMLYELEGVSGDDIAASLQIPVGTVWSRLFSARREFTSAIESEVSALGG